MIDFIKKLKLSVRVILLGAGSVLLTAVALVSLAVLQSGQYNRLAQKEVEGLINSDLDHIACGVYNLVRTENDAVQQRADGNLNVLRRLILKAGGISLAGESVAWLAANQFNGETFEISLPKMLAGDRWLGRNADASVETAIIDIIVRLNGESASIFQRINERGDMLRVATTVKNAAGLLAIGTYIPAVDPDGKDNPVISAIMKDGSYHGPAFEVNAKYLAAYEPLKDNTGRIIGMIYAGVKQEILESRVRQAILQTSLGKTGYVFVLGGTGKLRGHYIISQQGKRDGENIWNTQVEGRYVIHQIINTALSLKPGEFTAISYPWQNPGEPEPRRKIARLFYFAPWDWVIGVSVYEDELQTYKTVLNEGRRIMTDFMCAAGLFITLLIGFISIFISMTIIIPIQHITRAAEKITMGKFDQTVEVQSFDEIGRLATTFNFMTGRLNETMEGLRNNEEKLKESARKIRAIFDLSFEFIGLLTPEGTLIEVNESALNFAGVQLSDVIGKPFWETRFWSHSKEMQDKLKTAILKASNGEFVRFEVTNLDSRNEVRIIDFSLKPVNDDTGKVVFMIPEGHDITDRKAAETELLKHREHLEEMVRERTNELAAAKEIADTANKSKSLFLANMSHELRTPMNVILGFAHIMAQDTQIHPKHKENLKLILKSGEHLLTIINNILDISKIESGRLDAEVLDFDLGELIDGLISMLRVRAEAKNLQLTLDQSSSFPRFVRTDPAKLRQIIINLVGNSIKFTFKGSITVKLGIMSMNHKQNGQYLVFEIIDTGIGIAAADLKRIFQPFVQLGQHEGTGLGLAITQKYVELLGGSITVDSEPEKGSVFKFTIAHEPVDIDKIKIFTSPGKGGVIGFENAYKYRILIVEDHLESRKLLQNTLAPFGFQLLEADNGLISIELFKKYRPDLIFMDRRMPVLDGLQATAEIRKIPESAGTVIIAVTAHAFMDERQEMIKAGCNDFVAKPFFAERIFTVIEKYLNIRAIRTDDDIAPETPDFSLDRAAIAGLPETLRREFEDAIIRLDVALIGDIIRRIAGQNASLAKNLENYAGRFDYKPIIIALQEISGGKK